MYIYIYVYIYIYRSCIYAHDRDCTHNYFMLLCVYIYIGLRYFTLLVYNMYLEALNLYIYIYIYILDNNVENV